MASGTVYTNICGNTTFGTDPVYTIREARWYVSWSSSEVSHGRTKVEYTVWTEKKSESPSEIYTGCTIGIVATTGTIVSGDTSLSFANVGRKVCTNNGTRIKQQTTTGQGEATYSFLIDHTTAGAAAFRIDISAVINGNTVQRNGDGVCTLDTNRYDYLVSITNDTGATSSGGGWYRGGSSASITGGSNDGYTWTGWTGYATTSTNPYTFTMPDSNVAFTSNADPTTYSISFSLGNWSLPSGWANPTYYNIESSPITLPSCTKTGYTFSGWSGTGITGVASSVTIPTGSTGNRSYTANGSPNKYYIAYNGNGATSGSMDNSEHTYDIASNLRPNNFGRSYTVTYNHNYTGSTNTTRTATYKFSTWNTAANGGGTSYNNSASVTNLATSGTKTLYAQWDRSEAKISYTPSRTGYRFGGWYTTSALTTAVTHPYTPEDSTKTFFAKWDPNTYTVSYNGNGHTGGSTASSSHTYDVSKSLTSNGFTKTGYEFAGWATSSTGAVVHSNGKSVTNLTSTHGGTVTLYAKWTPITYSIAYNKNNGSGSTMSNSTHTYDEAKALTANTYTRAGYTFDSWNTKAAGTGTSYANRASVKNLSSTKNATVTLYAQWEPDSGTAYQVRHWKQKVGAGTAQNDQNFELAATDPKTGVTGSTTAAAAKSYTGFTAQSFDQSTISGDGTTTVNIYYHRNYFTLAMMVGTGITSVSPNSADIQYGSTVNASALVAPGYTWKQWTVSGTGAVTSNPYCFEMPANSVTLMAVATANSDTPYKVKHCRQALDGTYPVSLQETDTLYGTTATNTSATAKEYEGFKSLSFSQAEIKADGSTTITIKYTRNSYEVNLALGIGIKAVTGDGTYKYEESVTVTATMETGYTWSKWSGDKTSTSRSFTFTMPASDVNLTANSTANGYTITYVGQNGKQSVGAPNPGSTSDIVDSVVYNANVTVRHEANGFTRTGYKFLGWATSANSKVVSTAWPAGETKKWQRTTDLKLYAIWKSKGVLYVDTGSEFIPYTIWIDSGSATGGPNNNGWYQYTAWLDTGDESQGTNGWVQLGSVPD